MYKSMVYSGDVLLGEVEIYPENYNQKQKQENQEIIRISHTSQPSERCSPLAVLHTINSCGVCFKMEASTSLSHDSPIFLLHSSCLRENKTAVVSHGQEELHLVAMYSSTNERQYPCFWGFNVASGLYDSCLIMLNLRCLGIVFDLDETLVVANTMRSFEDKIEAIQRKINFEVDPQRISGMLAEIKRYQEDKAILRQYAENDQVIEDVKVIKVQSEVVPAVSDNHQPIVRPLIRIPEKNIILTRINPLIRDTSVLVRLRPAWEDLRSYLTAKGRKRFEVYVCTMAERDYALEMWRLLDPDSNLINRQKLLDRIVCVKSGIKKSLFDVFKNGSCHPKMALVVDDRLKVWDEKDQARVHVVPAFVPYYAPLAEANNTVPVLCVARNVACNVRGGFFKEFDESLLQRIPEVSYEDDIKDILSAPDVSNYLLSEEDASASNLNKDPIAVDGITETEAERRLKEVILGSLADPSMIAKLDPRLAPLFHTMASSGSAPIQTSPVSTVEFPITQSPLVSSPIKPLVNAGPSEPSLQSSPAREEGEVPESELDPDTRRRMLILQHGQDTRDQLLNEVPLPARPPIPVPAPQPQPRANWFPVENDISPGQPSRAIPNEFLSDSEAMRLNKFPPQPPPVFQKSHQRDDGLRFNPPSSFPSFPGEEAPLGRLNSINRNFEFETGPSAPYPETPAGCIMDIAMRCGTKVEFRPALVPSMQLQFAMEVLFAGEKVGEGAGRSRREAQHMATENSLRNLADRYLSEVRPDPNFMHGDVNRYPSANGNGFISDGNSFGYQRPHKEELLTFSSASHPRLEGSRRMMGSVSALKELCMMEGLGLNFQGHPPPSTNSIPNDEVFAQVEIDGQVLGRGVGLTWDEAKMQAAEKALVSVKSMLGQYTQKRQGSPRPVHQGMPIKRPKPEFSRALQRIPSARYPKNASHLS